MFKNYSLKKKLVLFFLLADLIPALIIMVILPFYFQWILNSETRVLTEGTMKSLTSNIKIYLQDLDRMTITPYINQDIMNSLKAKASQNYANIDEYSKFVFNNDISSNLLIYLQNSRDDILNTVLLCADGSVYITSKNGNLTLTDGYDFKSQSWYKDAVNADGKAVFISVHKQDYLNTTKTMEVFSVARLIKNPDTQKPLAVLMADDDASVLKGISDNVKFNVDSIVTIFDASHKVVYSTGTVSDSMIEQIFTPNSTRIKGNNDNYTVVNKDISDTGWKIVVMLSNSQMQRKIGFLYIVGAAFAIAGITLTLLLFSILSTSVVNPFKEMVRIMKKVQMGDFKVRYKISSNDEISQLGNALNDMIIRLNILIDNEYRAVLNQRNAEYYALQSQIQPHFLYNTLNGFVGLNRMGERDALEKAILSLKGMLHYILSKNVWPRIEEEIAFINCYCDLQKIRFEDRLATNISYDEDVGRYLIPKLLLQPLVENAVIHGIEPLSRLVVLNVTAEFVKDEINKFLRIVVSDDGAGFDTQALDFSKSVGISNIQERLAHAYSKATFTLTSEIGIGTKVVIEIPEKDLKL